MPKLMSVVLLSCVLQGCATTNREKILGSVLAAGATGVAISLSRDHASPQAAAYDAAALGGIGAGLAAIVGHLIWNSDDEADRYRKEANALRMEIFNREKPIVSVPATFSGKIPDKFKKLVRPGEWKVSEIDRWVEDGENRLIHHNMIMELTPPSLQVK